MMIKPALIVFLLALAVLGLSAQTLTVQGVSTKSEKAALEDARQRLGSQFWVSLDLRSAASILIEGNSSYDSIDPDADFRMTLTSSMRFLGEKTTTEKRMSGSDPHRVNLTVNIAESKRLYKPALETLAKTAKDQWDKYLTLEAEAEKEVLLDELLVVIEEFQNYRASAILLQIPSADFPVLSVDPIQVRMAYEQVKKSVDGPNRLLAILSREFGVSPRQTGIQVLAPLFDETAARTQLSLLVQERITNFLGSAGNNPSSAITGFYTLVNPNSEGIPEYIDLTLYMAKIRGGDQNSIQKMVTLRIMPYLFERYSYR